MPYTGKYKAVGYDVHGRPVFERVYAVDTLSEAIVRARADKPPLVHQLVVDRIDHPGNDGTVCHQSGRRLYLN